jgi:hypothetical protein
VTPDTPSAAQTVANATFRRLPKRELELRLPDPLEESVRTLATELRTSHSAIVASLLILATGKAPEDFGLGHTCNGLKRLAKTRRAG